MSQVYYELGKSGHGCCLVCDLDSLYLIGEGLPPGSYWIRELRDSGFPIADFGLNPQSPIEDPQSEDWGTLEVRGPGDWTLRALSGLQAGPGYLVV